MSIHSQSREGQEPGEGNKVEINNSQAPDKSNIPGDEKTPGTNPVNKVKKTAKKSSALRAALVGRSVTEQVKAVSSVDISGTSGLNNTGPVVSYEEGE